jgi:hypothetical protein
MSDLTTHPNPPNKEKSTGEGRERRLVKPHWQPGKKQRHELGLKRERTGAGVRGSQNY